MSKNIQLPYFDDFLLNLQINNYSQESIYNYERDLKVLQSFLSDVGVDFDNIDKKTILNYKAYLISRDRKTANKQSGQKQLSSYSINRMLSVFRSYIKFLIDMDYNSPVAPEVIKLVKTEKKHTRISEFDEMVKLIEYPSQLEKNKTVALRNRNMLELLFST